MSPPAESCVVGAKGTSPAEVVGAKGTSLAEVDGAVVASEDSAVGDEQGLKSWTALKSDKNEPCDTCETYLGMLVMSVEERLVKLLQGEPAVGGVSLKGCLYQQAPLTIDGGGQLQTTKEHWRWENCKKSLATKGLYEAPGSMFWLSKAQPSWGGTRIPAATITYGMMAAGRLVWSDEKFMRSSDDPSKRRYSIRFSMPRQPIRGSLCVGLLACSLDCGLARWLAGWLAGWLARGIVLDGYLSGWFAAWVVGCPAWRPKSGDRKPAEE